MGQETDTESCTPKTSVLKKVCVLGCGAMGTVLANLVARNLIDSDEYEQKVRTSSTKSIHVGDVAYTR